LKTANTAARADELTTAASRTANDENSTDGRLMGWLSIAAAPGAILFNPAVFALIAFALALFGLTVAAPAQRKWSFIGIGAAAVCGAIGHFFKTTLV
jgi:hypothetical protein